MTSLIAFVVSLLPSADLPLPYRFYLGAVFIIAAWALIGAATFLAPIVKRDLVAYFRGLLKPESPAKVVNFDERRRRLELGAAFTAVDDVRRAK